MVDLSPVAHTDPEILGGTPVFTGTRVPVRSLFDYLEAGDSLEEFLHQFPSVKRNQAISLLEAACESVTNLLLDEDLSALTTESYIANRAKNARKGAFGKVLDRVPQREPLPGDEIRG